MLKRELPNGTSVTFMMSPTAATASFRVVEMKSAHPPHRASVHAITGTGTGDPTCGEKAIELRARSADSMVASPRGGRVLSRGGRVEPRLRTKPPA